MGSGAGQQKYTYCLLPEEAVSFSPNDIITAETKYYTDIREHIHGIFEKHAHEPVSKNNLKTVIGENHVSVDSAVRDVFSALTTPKDPSHALLDYAVKIARAIDGKNAHDDVPVSRSTLANLLIGTEYESDMPRIHDILTRPRSTEHSLTLGDIRDIFDALGIGSMLDIRDGSNHSVYEAAVNAVQRHEDFAQTKYEYYLQHRIEALGLTDSMDNITTISELFAQKILEQIQKHRPEVPTIHSVCKDIAAKAQTYFQPDSTMDYMATIKKMISPSTSNPFIHIDENVLDAIAQALEIDLDDPLYQSAKKQELLYIAERLDDAKQQFAIIMSMLQPALEVLREKAERFSGSIREEDIRSALKKHVATQNPDSYIATATSILQEEGYEIIRD